MKAEEKQRWTRLATLWGVATAAGLVLGTGAGMAADQWQDARLADARAAYETWTPPAPPPSTEALDAALAEIDTHVALSPDVADLITDEELAQAREAVAGADTPTYLLFVAEPTADTQLGYNLEGVLSLMDQKVEGPAHLVVMTERGNVDTLASGLDDLRLEVEADGQPGPALLRVAGAAGRAEATPLEDVPAQARYQDWESPGGGIGGGLLIGALVFGPAAGLLWWGMTRRRA